MLFQRVDKMCLEFRNAERENLSATYGKVRDLENEIQSLCQQSAGGETQHDKDLRVQQLQEELDAKTKHYKKLIQDKEDELKRLGTGTAGGGESEIRGLREQVRELREENASYVQQIGALKKELDAQEKYFKEQNDKFQELYRREAEAAHSQGRHLAEMIQSAGRVDMSQAQTLVSESDAEMLQAAKEKIEALEQELRFQEEHELRESSEKDKQIESLKTRLAESYKQAEIMKRSMDHFQSELRDIKSQTHRDDYEKRTKDMRIAQMAQRLSSTKSGSEARESPPKPGPTAMTASKEGKKMSLQEIFSMWKKFYDDDNIKCDLMMKVLRDPELKAECAKSLQQYLLMLYQAFGSDRAALYETATISLGELISNKQLEVGEFRALCCEIKVVRSLVPQKSEETEEAAINRHSAALGALCYMDNINVEWTAGMTESLLETNGISTIKFYLEEFAEFEGIAILAAQVASYMASYRGNDVMLRETGIGETVMNLICKCGAVEAKRNAAECLAMLIKDAETRADLEKDERVERLIMELANQADRVYVENLLLCFVNLTVSKTFKKLLYDDGLIDSILPIFVSAANTPPKEKDMCVLYALKVVSNMSYPECPATQLPRLVGPLGKCLGATHDPATVQQFLQTIGKLVEDDEGCAMHEYGKLLPPVVALTRSLDKPTATKALGTILTICQRAGLQLLNDLNVRGELIKLCVQLYCTTEDKESASVAIKLLILYAQKGYEKDIAMLGKGGLVEKLFADSQGQTADDWGSSLQLLCYISEEPTSREKLLALPKAGPALNGFVAALTVPTPLSAEERFLL